MFCNNCGQEVSQGEAFCRKCGAPLAQNNQQAMYSGQQLNQAPNVGGYMQQPMYSQPMGMGVEREIASYKCTYYKSLFGQFSGKCKLTTSKIIHYGQPSAALWGLISFLLPETERFSLMYSDISSIEKTQYGLVSRVVIHTKSGDKYILGTTGYERDQIYDCLNGMLTGQPV
jgi:hypothetical protein